MVPRVVTVLPGWPQAERFKKPKFAANSEEN